ncbi:unnamed protein product [Bathycoccus prasinos]
MCNIWEIRTLKENTSACSQSFDSRDKSTIQRINSSEKSIFDKILDCVRCKVEELLPEVQNFTINSPLFSIGLTSSKVSRLNALIEKDLDISLPATLVFDFPTILDIAHFLVSSQGKAKADDLMKIVEFSFAEHLINMETFDENTPFSSLGINSANVLSITSSLNSNLRDMVDEDLPSTVIFDYPTKTSLASFIASKLNVEEGEGELLSSYRTNCENPCPKNSGGRITYLDKFDVIFPNSLNTYDVITRVPLDRWDLTNLSKSGIQVPSYFGGFIKNIGFFDASFALLSVQEALWVDPQQRLVLVCALKLNRVDLHILDEKQRKNHSSVFIGISQIEYPRINAIHASQRLSPYYATGSHLSVCAGRISYVLGLSGPSIAVDTACSSSLVSISMAHESLSRLISDHAFCGGVNTILDVRWNFACQAAKMLAADGRCKTFDYHGDGYVRTEACGVLVITSQNCSRHSLLVHGSSVNQDGRSSSLTAPHGPSQQAVIHEALSYSNANSPQLNLLHSHGTGTALGDPIEVGAVMDTVCSKNILFKDCLTICASKSILGHAEPASGIASMYFLCGALGYESCGQISHLRELNHHISVILRKHKHYFNFNRQTSYASIRSNHMIGSCSAFAFQGTNAHAALKRWIASFHPYLMKHMHFDDKLLWLSSTHSSLYPSCFFSSTDSIVFEVSYSELSSSEFQDHKVFGARICPAAGYFNLALLAPHQSMLQLAESSLCGDMFTISSPYLLSSSGKLRIILFLDFGICKIVSRNNKHMSGGTTLRAKLCSEGLCNESQVSNDLRRITSQLKHIKVSRYHRQNFRIFFRNIFTMYPERLLISSDTIITGGLGAVGKLITKWLSFDVSHSNIYLLSRRGRSNTYSHLKASTEPSINAVITIESKDCATSESVSGWRFALSSSLRIFHAAGSLADSIFFRQNYGRFCFVFSGKSIAGNLLIEKICTGFPLEVMILFSSTTSLLGNPGQSPYGAANAVLESIAHGNFKKGLHIKSPQFGALGGMFGMAVKKSKHLERSGIGFLEPFDCIVCVSQIMQCAQPGVFAIAAIDWTRYISLGSSSSFFHFNNSPQIKLKEKIISSNLESSIRDTISQSLYKLLNRKVGDLDPLLDAGLDSLSAVHLSSILEEKIPGVRCPSTLIFDYPTPGELCAFIENQVRKKNTETYTQSTQPTKNERRGYILDTHKTVQKIIVQILGHSINQSSPLMDAGFDSINAIEFTQAIQAAFPNATDEQILPATLIFDYPTIADIVDFLEKKPYASIDESHTGDTEILVNRQDIDFVCFEMCIPESSLRRGVKFDDSICCVPIDRWDIESKGWSFKLPQFAGFLTNVMKFDSSKYNLNSQEAKFIDPQQRFMLTKFEEVLDLESDRIMSGVFVGISTTDYDKRIRELPEQLLNSRVSVTATAFVSVVPGRVSFALNLCGPSVAIDTACSSGLVAVHIASGYSIKIAKTVSSFPNLMGAVNMIIYAPTSLLFKRAGMLADDGRCKTLDSGADGYVRAEACIAARLGPSHENISVLLSGTAVNQDGRSSSLTAPNGPSQRSVTRMAKCSCDGYLTTIGISIHGTGTPLGDPIEIGALDKDWIFSTSILATKTMFGHAESPAGLLSLAISASYFITEQKCTATLHLRNLSKHVVASISIFEKKMCIQRSLMPKVVQNNDSIGVNAFAFQGTNAHAILSLCRPSEEIFQHFPRCLYLNDQRDYWFTIKFHRIIMKVRTQSDIVIFYITMKRVLNSCIDHIVHGGALFPASGTLEVFRVTAKMISEMIPVLSHITFGRPLILQAALNSVCCRFTTGTNSVELSTLHPEHEQYKIALALVNETRYSSEHGKRCVGRNSFFSLCSTTSQHLMDHFALCLVMNTSRTDSGGWGITPAELDAGFHSMAALWTARAPLKIPAACEAYFFVLKSYAHSKFRRRNSRNTSIPISSRRSTQTDHMILGSKLASLLTKQLSNSNNECQKSDSKSNLKSFVEICPNTQGNICF